ncbi:MAG: OmpA family protein [Cryobacterium sp.]|nr:OmpA family protein [Oligoflexia bacterium]
MKKPLLGRSFALMSTSALLAMITLASCASGVKKYDYASTTSATDEITRLDGEMDAAMKNQANVLSPGHFADAREKLADAKKENQNRKSNQDVLDDLGYARAHLDAANAITARAGETIPSVVKARGDALAADAPRLRADKLKSADSALTDVTHDFEKNDYKLSVERRGELQQKYLAVELDSIKAKNLDDSKALIESAKKMKAEKLAKNTLISAEAKLQIAERAIETDRHDMATISRTSEDARNEAKRLMNITKLAKGAKEGTPEAIALDLEKRQNEANAANLTAEQRAAQLASSRQTVRNQSAVIGAVSAENAKLSEDQRFNDAFKSAQQNFDKSEAEVYRQGDKLLIRLKKMQFATGRSDLPKESLDVLSKVKDVVETMGAQSVVVEGHTDSVGSKDANMKLSDTRAKAVGEYLVSTNAITSDHLETKGYGFTRPITSNKTKEGRATNRRVDVIITPAKAEMKSDSGQNTSRNETPANTGTSVN